MASFRHKGNFSKTESFLKKALAPNYIKIAEQYGREGVSILSAATPKDTGETASSWRYEVRREEGYLLISWLNSHMAGDVPVAVLIQYGHGTRNGGYVQGTDFINPALRPLFDKIAQEVWKEVIR